MSYSPLETRRLRAWLRLLRLTRSTENHLREFLRTNYNTTLPRFDVAAALHRAGKPIKMSALSKMLLVSNGNVTTVIDRLEKDGMVRRVLNKEDRRVILVALTGAGYTWFEDIAKAHEAEVNTLFSGLGDPELDTIRDVLKRLDGETK